MIGAELATGPGDRTFDVAERGVDSFERRPADGLASGASADRPVAVGNLVGHAPAAETAGDDFRPRGQPAPGAISRLRKPLTGASLTLRERPSGWVGTAATNGVLPCAPRPACCPRRRLSSTDEMPLFTATIRWMAATQIVSGSLAE